MLIRVKDLLPPVLSAFHAETVHPAGDACFFQTSVEGSGLCFSVGAGVGDEGTRRAIWSVRACGHGESSPHDVFVPDVDADAFAKVYSTIDENADKVQIAREERIQLHDLQQDMRILIN
jgi:hypothetical protein